MSDTNDRVEFDTSQPFLAIVTDAEQSTQFQRKHAVYLVNPLDKPLTSVYVDAGIADGQPKRTGPYTMHPQSALRVETASADQFDDFVCWWAITYQVEARVRRALFNAGKALRNTDATINCYVLNRPALIVARAES